MRNTIYTLLCLLALAPGSDAAAQAPQPASDAPYQVQRGDDLDIRVMNLPELAQTVRVRPDGRISALVIGEVAVAGLTVAQITTLLRDQYATRFRDPDVGVTVTGFSNLNVFVGGDVGQPGQIPLSDGLTVSAAIVRAGGLRDTANAQRVVVTRDAGKSTASIVELNVEQVLISGKGDSLLRPGDIVYVPKGTLNIYVAGAVTQPGLVTLQGRLTVSSAVIRAGGATEQASIGSVVLLRNDGEGKAVVQKIDLGDILSKGAVDPELQPFDVVFVPKSRIAKIDQFVDQYIRQLLPITLSAGFSYLLGPTAVIR